MKFTAVAFEEKWNGRKMVHGKKIKQKTFKADDWDSAEEIARSFVNEIEKLRDITCSYRLTAVR